MSGASVKLSGTAEWEKYENHPEPIHWASSLGDHLAVREMVCGKEGRSGPVVHSRLQCLA